MGGSERAAGRLFETASPAEPRIPTPLGPESGFRGSLAAQACRLSKRTSAWCQRNAITLMCETMRQRDEPVTQRSANNDSNMTIPKIAISSSSRLGIQFEKMRLGRALQHGPARIDP